MNKIFNFIVLFLTIFMSTAVFADCTASATVSNECDYVSQDISAQENCSCMTFADYVKCTGTSTSPITGQDGGTETKEITKESRRLRDCGGGEDDPEGGGGDKGNDLSWCTGCYDSNGQLTALGEFFSHSNA